MDKDINKNLKDINSPLPNLPNPSRPPLVRGGQSIPPDKGEEKGVKGEERGGGLSYKKINKLITALYMVTDIIDKDEPIRNKLRTLGLEILSDTYTSFARTVLASRVDEVVSFLDIASALNFISEMNCAILKKEFFELKGSIQESTQVKPSWLEGFLKNSPLEEYPLGGGGRNLSTPTRWSLGHPSRGELIPKGHTRIGVQKGSTLMKALSSIKDMHKNDPAPYEAVGFRSGFDMLKKQRRFDITNIIKNNGGSSTIRDIRIKIGNGTQNSLTCSEKTLQRELMSMTKDGVLNKTGEKRWSRYFVKSNPS